jgi:uncharacterized membrane protein
MLPSIIAEVVPFIGLNIHFYILILSEVNWSSLHISSRAKVTHQYRLGSRDTIKSIGAERSS